MTISYYNNNFDINLLNKKLLINKKKCNNQIFFKKEIISKLTINYNFLFIIVNILIINNFLFCKLIFKLVSNWQFFIINFDC